MEKAAEGVVLLDFWVSPFGMRVRIALAEKGVQYEHREQNLLAKKSSILLESNPIHKKVPVLVHDGKPICESSLIVQYIDEVWNTTAPLLPADPYQRSQARFWGDYIDKKVYDSQGKLWKAKGEAQEEGKQEFLGIMRVLEAELGDKAFFGGESFGYVDVMLIPFTSWFPSYETCANFSMEKECPKLMAWAKRCMQRDTVANALPDPQKVYHDFICFFRKRLGIE